MACGFADKFPHYNAWWCDINHSSCGTAKAMNKPAPAPDTPVSGASDPAEKAKNKKNRKRGGE